MPIAFNPFGGGGGAHRHTLIGDAFDDGLTQVQAIERARRAAEIADRERAAIMVAEARQQRAGGLPGDLSSFAGTWKDRFDSHIRPPMDTDQHWNSPEKTGIDYLREKIDDWCGDALN